MQSNHCKLKVIRQELEMLKDELIKMKVTKRL